MKKRLFIPVLLLVFSVPWYWPKDLIRPFILGLPSWAFLSLVMSFLFAVSVAWILRSNWEDEESS